MYKIYDEGNRYAIYRISYYGMTRVKEFKTLKGAENWVKKNS